MQATRQPGPASRPILSPISIGRPRWTNITLAASLVLFWAGVILKILS
jgi:hypothetical protein